MVNQFEECVQRLYERRLFFHSFYTFSNSNQLSRFYISGVMEFFMMSSLLTVNPISGLIGSIYCTYLLGLVGNCAFDTVFFYLFQRNHHHQ